MERKIYKPTEKQLSKWSEFKAPEMPTDEEFKAQWSKKHHGKSTGWGMGKRDWIVSHMACCNEYQMGLWQARVDFVCGLDYQEKDENKAYNLGYYRGWHDGNALAGIDEATKQRLFAEYGNEK